MVSPAAKRLWHHLGCRDPCQEFPRDSCHSQGFSFLLLHRQDLGDELLRGRRGTKREQREIKEIRALMPFPLNLWSCRAGR